MSDIGVIILAAGEGKRMASEKSKVLCQVLFKPMINWVVDSCKNIGCCESDICIVCAENNIQDIIKVTDNKLQYVIQKERLGTGHAVKQTYGFLKSINKKNILIMLGDVPLISDDVLKNFYDYSVKEDNSVTILSSDIKDPYGYGRIVRDVNNCKNVLKIVEEVECLESEKKISEINSGVMCFKISDLIDVIDKIDNNNSNKEYYLTSAISILLKSNKKVGAFNCHDEKVVLGANTKLQLMRVNEIARLNIIEKLANNGVEFISSQGVVISPEVNIELNTVIYPGVILKGNTHIGQNCVITSNSYIESSYIDSNTVIKSSYIYNSKIGRNVNIGPFSNIRPNCYINDGVKIGDFVEIKNSVINKKTSVAHLTYIGDCDVGENVNFGCGCVTVNYDGKKKYKTVIGNNCFIGCNTNLIAPINIGDSSYTAAGSTVTDDVPKNAMCIARCRQTIKKDWKLN